jgi:hypothetical protein
MWEALLGVLNPFLEFLLPQAKEGLAQYHQLQQETSLTFTSASRFIFNFTAAEKPNEVETAADHIRTLSDRLQSFSAAIPKFTYSFLCLTRQVRSRQKMQDGGARLRRIANLTMIRQRNDWEAIRVMHNDAVQAQHLLGIQSWYARQDNSAPYKLTIDICNRKRGHRGEWMTSMDTEIPFTRQLNGSTSKGPTIRL